MVSHKMLLAVCVMLLLKDEMMFFFQDQLNPRFQEIMLIMFRFIEKFQ
jgi:hypothetical protein